MNSLLLLALAITPCAVFLGVILYMDRKDPEPFDLLMKVVFFGGVSVIPAALVEGFLIRPGSVLSDPFVQSLLIIGPIEEYCKLAVVLQTAWLHPAFNEENDGIVYVGMAAIGFAGLENILYVLQHGFGVGVIRAVLSVPMHIVCGIIMGYYLGLAKFAGERRVPAMDGTVLKDVPWSLMFRGWVIATLLHGFFDAFLLSGKLELILLVLPMGIAFFVVGYRLLSLGRNLSLKRWEHFPPPPLPPPLSVADGGTAPTVGNWKVWVSRTLFSLCAAFWGLLLIGYVNDPSAKHQLVDLVIGGIVLTFLPFLLGMTLEISWRLNLRPSPVPLPSGQPNVVKI